MKVSNNIHNIPILDEAEVITEYAGERKGAVEKSSTKLKFKLSSYALAPADRKKFRELEQGMM